MAGVGHWLYRLIKRLTWLTYSALPRRSEMRSMNRTLAVVVLVGTIDILWSAELRAADDADKSQEYVGCIEKAGGVTSEMLNCIGAEMNREDSRLTETHKRGAKA